MHINRHSDADDRHANDSYADNDRLTAITRHEASRRAMLRFAAIGTAGIGLGPLLTACGTDNGGSGDSSGDGSGKAAKGGSVLVVRDKDSVSFDKTMVFSNASTWVYVQIYETLTIGGKDGKTVEPWLATGWTQSTDKLTWTFALRKDVTFSDGTAMTSADVKFSIDEASSTKGGWEFINSAIDKVTAPDPHTLVITTKYPWAPLLADLACPSNGIIPKNYGGRGKKAFYEAPTGTGPFLWDTWDKGNRLTLKANRKYWRAGLPYLDKVTWQVVPDANTRSVMLRGGQAQIDENPPFSTLSQLEAVQGLDVTLFPSTRTDYLVMNEKHKPFDDVHVRRAISYAIDREQLIKAVLFDHGTPADSLFMPTVPYYDKNTRGQSYDMDRAKAELAKSSVPGGFSTTYLAAAGDSTDAAIAQVLQASLKELGITMKITNSDPSAVHDLQNKLDYDISHVYWTMDIADPDELAQFAVVPDGGGNSMFTGYSNKQAQHLAQQAAKTLSTGERQSLYSQLQNLLAQDAFVAPLFYSPLPYATSSAVKGFYVKPTGLYDMAVVSAH
ncbi:ABC transporter substrate-binding protein [Streptomyces sp. NPDC051572]|uniref:ABC transporter substrate-binding protein n=1 Tax=unclassified Streptomyces TaxID=2593676 RepID=UPI00344FFC46